MAAPALELVRTIRIPTDAEFGEKTFIESEALDDLASELRFRHNMPTEVKIAVLWKQKGGKSGGKIVLGQANLTASGLLGFYAPVEVVIWLAADHLRELQATPETIEALLFHELCHVAVDEEKLTPKLVAHDFAGFAAELEHYGMWDTELRRAGEAFQQARMFAP